ncbi:MAG: glycosyltransferase family 2 protein [Bacteroidales bacterium]|nr:glycosyltransferase family 2 protein [Bacteroidales bacterium]
MEKLSIVVCVYNEEENIAPLTEQVYKAMEGYNFELVFVDDGSKDNTIKEILKFNRKEIHLVELRKNYGQSSALAAGIDYASGDYIVTIDGDLQNDPSDIPAMLKMLKDEDLDLVAGIRKNRQDGMFLRKIPSKIANLIIRMTTDVRMKDYGCTLKVFKSDIAKSIGLYGELHRFIPVLAHLEGARLGQMDVKHHSRQFGKSKYGINRTFKVMSDLMLMLFFKKFMQKPMHLFGIGGLIAAGIGIIINFYLLALKIMGHDIWGKPLLILGLLFLLAGIQLVTVGLLAEVLMRTYYESQNKKPYKVRRVRTGDPNMFAN